jgi:cysteine desulfurase
MSSKNIKSASGVPIYLDYAATTPVHDSVIAEMGQCMGQDGIFGNPASRSHSFGWQAEERVEWARGMLAELIGADPREIVWTSGATEADNLAIKGVARFYSEERGKHIVTSKIEHKAVLDACRQLEREGFEISYVEPDKQGRIEVSAVEAALREDTVLVSVMHANNEIGTINDIAGIGALLRSRKILFHCDAAQTVGKIPVDVNELQVDLLSTCAHKMYGPKGIGALYVRRKPRVRLEAQIHGGGHERGMRSGTLPTHQIVGFGAACKLAKESMGEEAARVRKIRDGFWNKMNGMEQVFLNGDLENGLPGHLNFSVNYVEGESLMMALKDIAISSGSACTSASLEPSYVLRALGLNDELAHSSLRISMGRYTTEEEMDYVAQELSASITKLREMSPLWDMYKDGVDLDSVEWQEHA